MFVSHSKNIRVRFAPSPTGELHLGSARTALFNYLFAKKNNGKFLLRIEDTDKERSFTSHIEQAINSIMWLGFEPDEEIVFQSNRSKIYKEYLNHLLKTGVAYRCFASKEELRNIRNDTNSYQYNGLWRNKSKDETNKQLAKGKPFTIRLKTPNTGNITFEDLIYGEIKVSNEEIDDFIIARSDGSPVYNFTNVIDDNEMKISHVIRGEDHVSNTPKQLLIYHSLGFKNPTFAHLPMILGEDKKKLSKRHGAESVESYRNTGFQSGPLINYLALLGWNPGNDNEIMDLKELISLFNMQKVQRKSAVFDPKKFNWINSQYLSKENPTSILSSIRNIDSNWGINKEDDYCFKVINLMKPRSNTINDIISKSQYCFKKPDTYSASDHKKVWTDQTGEILKNTILFFENIEFDKSQILEDLFKNFIKTSGLSSGQVMKPMRLAICGSLTGPSLFDLMELFGFEEYKDRLNKYIDEFNYENKSNILDKNFVERIIDGDLASDKWGGRVHTRFPPEPNGYLHIGHAKSICLNFDLAKQYGGKCNLRFDDTNPLKEESEFVESISEDVKWLGYNWNGNPLFASDYFNEMYNYALKLVELGKAYVCDQNPEDIKKCRGTLTMPGVESPYRNRSVNENLELFQEMKNGTFKNGEKTLRAKIDMSHPNLNMRDPVIYRILHAKHHRTGKNGVFIRCMIGHMG